MTKPKLGRRHPELPPSQIEISEQASFGIDVRIDLTGDLTIGAGTHLAHRVSVITHSHTNLTGPIHKGKVGPPQGCPLKIGKNVFVGENAVILPQVGSIGDWAVIGAYSVVTKPVGAGEIWAGNPAKFIRHRDEWESVDEPHSQKPQAPSPDFEESLSAAQALLSSETGNNPLLQVLNDIYSSTREKRTRQLASAAITRARELDAHYQALLREERSRTD